MRRLVLALLLSACDSAPPPPSETPPAAPAENDPAFQVIGVQGWYLVGDGLTAAQDEMPVEVIAPEDTGYVDAWVAGGPGVRMDPGGGGEFHLVFDLSALGPGEYDIILAADGGDPGFARLTFKRTAALYVLMTNDWDGSDNTDTSLTLQEELHTEFPSLVMTHFVGPYLFTDPAQTPERRQLLTDWVAGMRDTYGDEIGLHIHPFCNFVDTTSVTCRTEPSTVYASGDATGYTVECAAYTEEEFTTLLEAGDQLLEAAGLGKPTSFRAGGWTADLGTLRALAAAGYLTDTSANNWARMEEWMGQQNGVLYDWNMTHWSTIGDTSQPYYPSADDILVPGDPDVGVLELPDNAILVDYVTSEEMIAIFDANWDGATPLEAPIAYSFGYHPTNFNANYKRRLRDALLHIDQYQAAPHHGPVVYGRQTDMVEVWPR